MTSKFVFSTLALAVAMATANANAATLDATTGNASLSAEESDPITSFQVSGGHSGTVTGENIVINTVVNVTTDGRPDNPASSAAIGTAETNKVLIDVESGSGLNVNGSDLTIRGQDIEILTKSDNLITGYGNTVIGGEETNSIKVSGGQYGFSLLPYSKKPNTNGSLTLTAKNVDISAADTGLWVQNNSTGYEDAYARVTINADDISIVAGSNGIVSMSQGDVELNGNVYIDAENAILTRGLSKVTINKNGEHTVKLNGNINFNYDEYTSKTGVNADLTINLSTADSYWNGNTLVSWGTGKPSDDAKLNVSSMKLSLSNGAQWNVANIINNDGTESGRLYVPLSELTLNNGIINITEASDQKVEIDRMYGTGGTVNLLTTVAEDGKLTATTVDFGEILSETAPTIAVTYSGITADDVKSNNLGDIEGGVSAKEGSAFKESRFVQQGAIKGALTETYDENGKLLSRTIAENTRLNAYGSVAALSIMQWRHEMNDLTKRMGELRTSPEGVGSWVRIYGSEQEYGSQNITTRNNSIQVGADADVGYGWKVGAAFSYTDGKADYDLGNADNKSYGLGIYGTWMADNGQFIDLIAKYSRLDSDFELEGMDGSSDNNAFSVSAEYGWHLKLAQTGFVEPQAEVTYGYIQGDKFHTSNGVEIDQDDFESLIGRVGVRSGFYLPNNKGVIYARVSGLHDFKGDFDSTATLMSDRTLFDHVSEDLGDTWVEFGVGANFNWTDTTYCYVDLERTNGGDVKENWRWNVGLRHVF